ncbi:MAG: DUF935 domain-containing protein [Verrucomicrobiales bacterium]|jgi:phage gp29-like protein|nr:DUF935 domain-containing protein [Verrucomicrobiales bacterium]
MSAASAITPERVAQEKRSRYNPIANLTPQLLSAQMDSFAIGYLPAFARTLDKMFERDDVLRAVVPKRCKDTSRRPWRIVKTDTGSDQAQAARAEEHKQKLEFFYNNLTATEALDEDRRGGARLLVQQMMTSVGFGKAAHEILWQPSADGGLTAEFRFVPLWFFENTTARLRFLPYEGSIDGAPLEPNKWLVTAGDGLGPASAVAYMFKHLPLRDWLSYCERFGLPYVLGKTSATKGTDDWRAMADAVRSFIGDGGAVVNREELIELITASAQGTMPQSALTERMDRALAALWRGADLSTISAGTGDGAGASLQGREGDLLLEDDCVMVSEALQQQIDPAVIRYFFGAEEPLAYFELEPPARKNIDQDLKVDDFLVRNGARLSTRETLERYGRSEAEAGEPALTAQTPESKFQTPNKLQFPNTELPKNFAALLARADQPLTARLEQLLAADGDAFATELAKLQAELPELLKGADGETVKAWEQVLGAQLVEGLTEEQV